MSSSVHDILSTSGKRVCTFVWSVFRLLCMCVLYIILVLGNCGGLKSAVDKTVVD